MNLDTLIQQAEELKSVPGDSPKVLLWKKRSKQYVLAHYEPEYKKILDRALSFGQVIMDEAHGQHMHIVAMSKAIEYLESLKGEPTTEESFPHSLPSSSKYPLDMLHQKIRERCESLFEKEEYSESAEKGFKVVRDRLRELTSFERGGDAFGRGGLYIKGAAAAHVDNDFNQAVKHLTMAIDMFRNEKSHTADGNIDNPNRAFEYLVLSSLAMNLLDNVEIKQKVN